MNVFEFIDEKRLGKAHSEADIREFVREYTDGNVPDYQAAAWLMAVCIKGMTDEETAVLTDAMAHSGEMLSPLPGKFCVDKHSTGGIGDKVTLFAAPVCAACGVYVPKMSGRGLGNTGGTIDKLESIPGFRTSLDYNEFISIVEKNGFAVAGQTGKLVPADKKLYALRDATATVESIPLICSSVMSKKLATGADGIVLDVKAGTGAFMKDINSAEKLAIAMLSAAERAGKKCTAVITDMNKPLGKNVGNALEVIEAIEALKGRYDDDFYEVASEITAEMLMLAGCGDENECRSLVEAAVSSGRALEAFERTIALQGGNGNVCRDYSLFGKAAYKKEIYAPQSGYIKEISCGITGLCALELGAGRHKKGDPIDMNAGIVFNVSVGDYVEKGSPLAVLYSSDSAKTEEMSGRLLSAFSYCDEKVTKCRNVIKILRNS